MAYGQCECLTWAWAPEMGPRSNDGHHPNCPEGHPEGCGCLRCRMFKADEILGDSIANKVSHWHGRLEEASQKSIAEYHQTIVEAVEDTGGGFFLDVAGENVAWAQYVIEVKQKAAERVKLYERALRAIVKAAEREVYWGLPEAGRVAGEALQGKDTFLNMLEFQGDISRQRKRDELQVASKQELDKLAAVVNELVGDRERERKKTIEFRRQVLRGVGVPEFLIDSQYPLPEGDGAADKDGGGE